MKRIRLMKKSVKKNNDIHSYCYFSQFLFDFAFQQKLSVLYLINVHNFIQEIMATGHFALSHHCIIRLRGKECGFGLRVIVSYQLMCSKLVLARQKMFKNFIRYSFQSLSFTTALILYFVLANNHSKFLYIAKSTV